MGNGYLEQNEDRIIFDTEFCGCELAQDCTLVLAVTSLRILQSIYLAAL